jgi:hypothetical protein
MVENIKEIIRLRLEEVKDGEELEKVIKEIEKEHNIRIEIYEKEIHTLYTLIYVVRVYDDKGNLLDEFVF